MLTLAISYFASSRLRVCDEALFSTFKFTMHDFGFSLRSKFQFHDEAFLSLRFPMNNLSFGRQSKIRKYAFYALFCVFEVSDDQCQFELTIQDQRMFFYSFFSGV